MVNPGQKPESAGPFGLTRTRPYRSTGSDAEHGRASAKSSEPGLATGSQTRRAHHHQASHYSVAFVSHQRAAKMVIKRVLLLV